MDEFTIGLFIGMAIGLVLYIIIGLYVLATYKVVDIPKEGAYEYAEIQPTTSFIDLHSDMTPDQCKEAKEMEDKINNAVDSMNKEAGKDIIHGKCKITFAKEEESDE